ncbi:MAG: fluoride efflux transporter CrcB [Cytophagaceae bacterium]|nr:fluoride efflux transporter CrcB [Gemmatimonadaceae bacterium]
MQILLAVAAGSATGGVARYLMTGALQSRTPGAFPVGTLTVNIIGSFILGAVARYAAMNPAFSPELRLLLGAGFCGGFTTFSAFSVEALELMQLGDYSRALGYAAISVLAAVAAAALGMAAVRALVEG